MVERYRSTKKKNGHDKEPVYRNGELVHSNGSTSSELSARLRGNKGALKRMNKRKALSLAKLAFTRRTKNGMTRFYAGMSKLAKNFAKNGDLATAHFAMDRFVGRPEQVTKLEGTLKTANLNINREMTAQEASDVYQQMLRDQSGGDE